MDRFILSSVADGYRWEDPDTASWRLLLIDYGVDSLLRPAITIVLSD